MNMSYDKYLSMSEYLRYDYKIKINNIDGLTFNYDFDFTLGEEHNCNNKIIPKNSAIDIIIEDDVIFIETLFTRTITYLPIYNEDGFSWLDILNGICDVYNDLYMEYITSKSKNMPSLYYDDETKPIILSDMEIYDLTIHMDPKNTKIIKLHVHV